MINWIQLAKKYFEETKVLDELDEIVLRDGARPEEIGAVSRDLGFSFPSEFVSFYSATDGLGFLGDSKRENVSWRLPPLDDLKKYIESVRLWLECHEELASRFFPIIHFQNGEGIGYLIDEDGRLLQGLYEFNSARYEFDEEQEYDEFLINNYSGIEHFLTE
jgi:hypothetical protein